MPVDVHMAQVVSLIIDAVTDFLKCIENEKFKKIPIQRYLQYEHLLMK